MKAADPLAPILVLDRLDVEPVEITPRSLRARYRVTRGSRSRSTELRYRYEEDVFTPGDRASHNLASMIAAQVAVNYGLFAREITFHGEFDAHDRAFLRGMTENTAREIYVKKFLEPNPFLTGAARVLPVIRRKRYLRARIRFVRRNSSRSPATRGRGAHHQTGQRVDGAGCAVLSSGGKESLLTFGLLDELGLDPHALFVNESGRHWFTALNGYRHLAGISPRTARVWTSADRVFAWMIRQLPFIRRDFARVRSDDYPERLWTVAVFLFGVMPLLRKRGIRRVLIGDEFDTTREATTHGIRHHDGLYDQSLFFDRALSRYYRRKGWPLIQFSALRPLSEFLVQKMLAERYPDLLRHQVSCHAAHVRGGRVYPCGRCEKCRRVIGMLSAIGANPGTCGYDAHAVRASLRSLGSGAGVHQESAGAEHVLRLLVDRGILPANAPAAAKARRHPEIERLRFDPLRSPAGEIPSDLAVRLYSMYLEHCAGTLRRQGGRWVASGTAPTRTSRYG